MITGAEITGPLAALGAGLVTSLHCIGMCGPLACTACSRGGGRGSMGATLVYHGTRIIAYSLLGVAAGLVGRRLSDALLGGMTGWVAWLFVIFFLAVALGLDKRVRLPLPKGAVAWLGAASARRGPYGRAGLLGFFTPLLPCAPLYIVVAAAGLSGSARSAAVIMASFAIGTVPLLLALQSQYFRIAAKWSPAAMDRVRRGLALAAVVVLLIRGAWSASTGCPMSQ